jgi:hypothetical protein
MATLYGTKPITVKVTGTGVVGGMPARALNRRTGEYHPEVSVLSSDGHINFDCGAFVQGYLPNDVIECSVSGPAYGACLITISGVKGQNGTIAATALSATLPKGGN